MNTYIIENESLSAEVIDYGARIKSLIYKDAGIDVVAGCDTAQDYLLDANANFGAAIGRYANRIAGARFTLNGTTYSLPQNDGDNCLHGGNGFAHRYFDCVKTAPDRLSCTYTAQDMEEGFPGTLTLRMEYILDGAALRIRYHATCDRDTVANFTNHSYFNLNGGGTALDHILCIDADSYLPVDEALIPQGSAQSVADTPFDFREPIAIGARINDDHPQLTAGSGYDHNYILNGSGLRNVAYLYSPESGVRMDVITDLPGLQLYSGNFMHDPAPLMRGGTPQRARDAICLETQFYPNSPNRPDFPDCVLLAGEAFFSETAYAFSIE